MLSLIKQILNEKVSINQIGNEVKHTVLFQVPPTKEVSTQPPRVSPTLPSSNPTVHVVSMISPQRRNESESKE